MGIIFPLNLISQPLTKPKFNEVNLYSKQSFITKAIERTGPSVVTIDTERYVKKDEQSGNLSASKITLKAQKSYKTFFDSKFLKLMQNFN